MVIHKRREKIPATMVSQHPDHAGRPYWHTEEFIGTAQESYECYLSFSELGVSEYKWDWEGKLVDESVIERLLSDYYEFFKKNPIGKEKFLTISARTCFLFFRHSDFSIRANSGTLSPA